MKKGMMRFVVMLLAVMMIIMNAAPAFAETESNSAGGDNTPKLSVSYSPSNTTGHYLWTERSAKGCGSRKSCENAGKGSLDDVLREGKSHSQQTERNKLFHGLPLRYDISGRESGMGACDKQRSHPGSELGMGRNQCRICRSGTSPQYAEQQVHQSQHSLLRERRENLLGYVPRQLIRASVQQ